MRATRWVVGLGLLTVLSTGGCHTAAGPSGDEDGGVAERFDPIVPVAGSASEEVVDCTARWTPPAALTGPDGLGRFSWTWEDLRFPLAWNRSNRFVNRWISSNDDAVPSARVRPQLLPAAGYCLQQDVAAATAPADAGDGFTAGLLGAVSPFSRRDTGLDDMRRRLYASPEYDLSGGNVLLRALRGLVELPNELPGAPSVAPWDEAQEQSIRETVELYPVEVQDALAGLVLSVGEAYLLKRAALAEADLEVVERIHDRFRLESYASLQATLVSPAGGSVVEDLLAEADDVDLSQFVAAAQAVGQAADRVRLALAASGPIDAPELRVDTPHGRILVRTDLGHELYGPDELDGTAIVVDAAGRDAWGTGVGATTRFWMAASVAIDVEGDDVYGIDTPDIEGGGASAAAVFSPDFGFSQGMGAFGVGLLVDGAGDDTYRASVYSQGTGVFGVGLLLDVGGADIYRLGHMGQGAGYFGVGLHVDVAGNDRYRVYSMGQGAGKPGGMGLLLDLLGDDDYLGYNEEHGPELPGSGVPNYFKLPPTWAYNDGEKAHYMSACQGVGWGYRGDWLENGENWMGGVGALVDLGAGRDTHTADTFSMGQGFVYGLGFLYDDGGDDRYRTFWWGPGAAAHMGLGLFIDEDGHDDLYVTRASGGFGYDGAVAWILDHGGNDTYGGKFRYGESNTYGLTFFVNDGGDDTYNAGGALASPIFGGVRKGWAGVNLVGAFLDLGAGSDLYVNAPDAVGDGRAWHLEPVVPLDGQALDPDHHKGIGIDE